MSGYNCGWGCKRYNSLCDACDSYMYEDQGFRSEKEVETAWKKAHKGLNPWGDEEYEE